MHLKAILWIFVVFFNNDSFLNAESVCEFPFIHIEGTSSCFYVVDNSTESVPWLTAKEACNRFGAHLAILDTYEKNSSVTSYLRTALTDSFERKFKWYDHFWIGLYDQYHGNSYIWDGTGRVSEFKDKREQKPSLNPVNHCVVITPGDLQETIDSAWQISECGSNNFGYICEKPLHCPTPTLPRCEDYEGFEFVENAGCLHIHYSSTHDWLDAKEYCERKDGRLVVMEMEEKYEAIREHIQMRNKYKTCNFWTGLYDTSHKGKWFWNELGIEANYSGFAVGEPSGGVNHNCVYLNQYVEHQWTDSRCNKELNYICEIPSACLNTDTITTEKPTSTTQNTTLGFENINVLVT